MSEFFKTKMGAIFFEGTIPRIAKALESIAKSVKSIAATIDKPLNDALGEIDRTELAKIKPHLDHIDCLEVAFYGDDDSATVECTKCGCIISEIYNKEWE